MGQHPVWFLVLSPPIHPLPVSHPRPWNTMVLWAPPVKLWTCAAARGTSGGKLWRGETQLGRGTSCRRSLVFPIYCRASHTGDACRGRGRERERGISSELADMTCCELHLRCRRCCCCFWSSFSFSFLFLFVLSLSLSLLSSLSSLSSLALLSSSWSSSASSSSLLLLLL